METATAETVREELYRDNETFRELVQQHKSYEDRLLELAELTYPNDEELLEETTLKKKKLQIKDQIYSMILEHADTH
jgi:uncharacterized protein YdcH (DUF465 family)